MDLVSLLGLRNGRSHDLVGFGGLSAKLTGSVAHPVNIRSLLNDLPKTLDETYRRSLLGIDEEKREYARRLFLCLTVSIRPLRVDELAEFLAVRFNGKAIPTSSAAWRPENAELRQKKR